MNSAPMKLPRTRLPARTPVATPATTRRLAMHQASAGSYSLRAHVTMKLSRSSSLAGRNREASAGTSVSESTNAPASAKSTVMAMGRNIFPSVPPRARIGR